MLCNMTSVHLIRMFANICDVMICHPWLSSRPTGSKPQTDHVFFCWCLPNTANGLIDHHAKNTLVLVIPFHHHPILHNTLCPYQCESLSSSTLTLKFKVLKAGLCRPRCESPIPPLTAFRRPTRPHLENSRGNPRVSRALPLP
jgi:hypothetical protein